ncbi:MAG: XdhC family protein, partial [Bacteroidales bacterium]|nr:XdhC family protein [Bacteroidales bacterium]
MKNIYYSLLGELDKSKRIVLATILRTKGSAPQVPGASAVFSEDKLLAGTLGGGILEGDASHRAREVIKHNSSVVYEFDLNADISSEEGAICGGTVKLLLDAGVDKKRDVLIALNKSLSLGKPGILATVIPGKDGSSAERFWLEYGEIKGGQIPGELKELREEITSCLQKKICQYVEKSNTFAVFLEPVYPLPRLVIAGAGHIGKALSHMANLLDFEVTVIDNRPEYANPENIPEADHIVVDSIGRAIGRISKSSDTHIVIVTRGHRDDADALRACIESDLPYIGMIGSKRKISLMRENFLSKGWATEEQFDRVHAPVGLEIGSRTVQEIAVSILAQLVQVRNRDMSSGNDPYITAIILAAGESRR